MKMTEFFPLKVYLFILKVRDLLIEGFNSQLIKGNVIPDDGMGCTYEHYIDAD